MDTTEAENIHLFEHIVVQVKNKTDEVLKNVSLINADFEKNESVSYKSLTEVKYEEFLAEIKEGFYSYPNKVGKLKLEGKFLKKLSEEEVSSLLMYNVNSSSDAKYNFSFSIKRNPMQEQLDMIEFETNIGLTTVADIILAELPPKATFTIHLYK